MLGDGTVLSLCSMLSAELCLLSDKCLNLCYCRLQTLQPLCFQLLCSGCSWEKSYSTGVRLTMKLSSMYS